MLVGWPALLGLMLLELATGTEPKLELVELLKDRGLVRFDEGNTLWAFAILLRKLLGDCGKTIFDSRSSELVNSANTSEISLPI
jgi:hypothetical protein